MRRDVLRAGVVALVALATGLAPQAASAASSPALPTSMASLGDSITRAYDVCCWYGDHPGQSWTTGYTSYDGVTSHYERIRVVQPKISGNEDNDARTGAKMVEGPSQAATAVSQGARYVTVLLGANDLCTSSTATMTSTEQFRAQFDSTLSTLEQQRRAPYVFVSSLPDLYQLWTTLHGNATAQAVWDWAHICPSMLASNATEEQRQQVVTREEAFNSILGEVCAAHARCRYDGGATYAYAFSAGQVSTLDYFHPSRSGQAALAGLTWRHSWWPTV